MATFKARKFCISTRVFLLSLVTVHWTAALHVIEKFSSKILTLSLFLPLSKEMQRELKSWFGVQHDNQLRSLHTEHVH